METDVVANTLNQPAAMQAMMNAGYGSNMLRLMTAVNGDTINAPAASRYFWGKQQAPAWREHAAALIARYAAQSLEGQTLPDSLEPKKQTTVTIIRALLDLYESQSRATEADRAYAEAVVAANAEEMQTLIEAEKIRRNLEDG